ncbi:MAG TPA: hypothetical protein VIB80_04900 [Aquiluna sp.]
MSKQWLQIVAIWVATLIFGILALLNFSGDALYTLFAAIAASAIALVSIEHLISAKAKDTIRQQVYVSAGTMAILGSLTLVSFAG